MSTSPIDKIVNQDKITSQSSLHWQVEYCTTGNNGDIDVHANNGKPFYKALYQGRDVSKALNDHIRYLNAHNTNEIQYIPLDELLSKRHLTVGHIENRSPLSVLNGIDTKDKAVWQEKLEKFLDNNSVAADIQSHTLNFYGEYGSSKHTLRTTINLDRLNDITIYQGKEIESKAVKGYIMAAIGMSEHEAYCTNTLREMDQFYATQYYEEELNYIPYTPFYNHNNKIIVAEITGRKDEVKMYEISESIPYTCNLRADKTEYVASQSDDENKKIPIYISQSTQYYNINLESLLQHFIGDEPVIRRHDLEQPRFNERLNLTLDLREQLNDVVKPISYESGPWSLTYHATPVRTPIFVNTHHDEPFVKAIYNGQDVTDLLNKEAKEVDQTHFEYIDELMEKTNINRFINLVERKYERTANKKINLQLSPTSSNDKSVSR